MTIPAFRYVDGALVQFDTEARAVILIPASGSLDVRNVFRVFPPRSARERRQWARQRSRGRRTARRVVRPGPRPRYEPTLATVTLVRHTLQDGDGRRTYLYLPDGEKLTDAHCRDIERIIGRCGSRRV